jgi:HlyD family secretion protein
VIAAFICSFSIAASLAFCGPLPTRIAGYVEGEYVRIGPLDTARIETVAVRRGERVAPGAVLALLQTDDAQNSLAESEARLIQVRAQLANLLSGKRPEELAVIEASAASAKAQEREADRALERRQDLFRRGVSTQADLDQAQTARDVAAANVRQSAANLAVARLPAREEEIRAAEKQVAQAQAALDQSNWRLSQRRLVAPAAGIVADLVRRPGELAGPTAPVLTLLPDGAIKLMVYVPEALLAGMVVGTRLDVSCSGCQPGLSATVSYVAQEPEFTPPVIYSAETRQKLVYLIEARPEGAQAAKLQPGQIIDVSLRGR